ncbi:carboxymuconolactone decarboxylase family protein [Legionella fallonii]|uniref:Carboxymuconolactone decarboxylase-like domain-containing protein n=1 Tax=Legionella fallonii LLAP-10 TaxID=1212491 RepID=A0A098G9Q7_9GAMM|nr:hypothetical protein [Legionella fallonii]CEG58722.1 conserved protein of unknown function [Legionella fallonii LLAP-10]
MSYIKLSDHGNTAFERLMGHAPRILKYWEQLENEFFKSKHFNSDFLEQLRRALAFNNLCHYCMTKAGPPDEQPDSIRLNEALRLANLFAINHHNINQTEIERMKQYFSEEEIIELIAFFSFISASQKFGASLGLQAASEYAPKDAR